jgi:hypothetical protein
MVGKVGEDRAQQIESYGKAYDLLVEGLQQFPREMWQFRAGPEDWTIHEIVVHIADSEANSFVRCRRFIAEPGKEVMAYDEMGWAEALHYHEQSTEEALELFKCLRRNTYHLIKNLPDAVWSNTVYHPENGTMSFDDWLHTYERHIPDHLEQMQRVYAAWKQQNQ